MKVSKTTKAEHREKIIKNASKRFRERGFDGIGVSDLMKEAGLTHGGFYGHFDSKEELVELASQRALDESVARWANIIREAEGDPLKAMAESYLSARHRDAPGTGCLYAAAGGDIARAPASVRRVVDGRYQRALDLIANVTRGRTKAERRKHAINALATMVGGIVLARSVNDPTLSDEILQTLARSVPERNGESLKVSPDKQAAD